MFSICVSVLIACNPGIAPTTHKDTDLESFFFFFEAQIRNAQKTHRDTLLLMVKKKIRGMLRENSRRDNETQDEGGLKNRGLTAVEHPIEGLN